MRLLILILILATCVWGGSLLAQAPTPGTQNVPAVALTETQQLRARVLQLDAETDALRRTILALQIQIAQLKTPTDQAARDKAWTALEATLGPGCKVDRATLAVTCAPLPARPLSPTSTKPSGR
jgi:outer membrane murein-binding lipoprotein Lpp